MKLLFTLAGNEYFLFIREKIYRVFDKWIIRSLKSNIINSPWNFDDKINYQENAVTSIIYRENYLIYQNLT